MKAWKWVYAVLTAVFLLTAALNLLHVRAGFLTNYGSDLIVPAWLYVVVRGLSGHRSTSKLKALLGSSPEIAAVSIFAASTITELCQRWWPHGIFRGHYDPYDIVAFGAGVFVCYVFDRASLRRSVAIAMLLCACSRGETGPAVQQTSPPPSSPPAQSTSSQPPVVETEAPVPQVVSSPEKTVEEFGRRMKNVSLLASPDVAGGAIRQQYAGLVEPALLDRWASAPATAPGRQVSSPWPDRIEIRNTTKNGDTATVDGELVEAASTGDTRRVPVALRLQRSGETWLISAYAVHEESSEAANAAAVVRAYYDAIAARDFKSAYAMWGSAGPPHQTFDAFVSGFADTASSKVTTGTPSRIEGAAGSQYVEIPVTIVATTKSGGTQRFEGTYTLRRAMVDGAAATDRKWHLHRATLRKH